MFLRDKKEKGTYWCENIDRDCSGDWSWAKKRCDFKGRFTDCVVWQINLKTGELSRLVREGKFDKWFGRKKDEGEKHLE